MKGILACLVEVSQKGSMCHEVLDALCATSGGEEAVFCANRKVDKVPGLE